MTIGRSRYAAPVAAFLMFAAIILTAAPAQAGADAPLPTRVDPATPGAVSGDQITKLDATVMTAKNIDQMVGTRWREIGNPDRDTDCAIDIAFLPVDQQLDICDLRFNAHMGYPTMQYRSPGPGWYFDPGQPVTRAGWVTWLGKTQFMVNNYNAKITDDPTYGMHSTANGYGHMDDKPVSGDPTAGSKGFYDYNSAVADRLSMPYQRVLEPSGLWGSPRYEPTDPQTVAQTQMNLARLYCSNLSAEEGLGLDQSNLPDGCWQAWWETNGGYLGTGQSFWDDEYDYQWIDDTNTPGNGLCYC